MSYEKIFLERARHSAKTHNVSLTLLSADTARNFRLEVASKYKPLHFISAKDPASWCWLHPPFADEIASHTLWGIKVLDDMNSILPMDDVLVTYDGKTWLVFKISNLAGIGQFLRLTGSFYLFDSEMTFLITLNAENGSINAAGAAIDWFKKYENKEQE